MEKIVSAIKDWFEKYQPDGTMIERYLWAFWVLWVLLILVAVLRVVKFRFGLVREKRIWGDGSGIQKSAAVIVPIKGVSPSHTSDFFQSLLEQNYARYRVIVAVESSDDPAAEWLFSQFGISLSNPVWVAENDEHGFQDLRLVVAGQSKGQGQKIQNQLAAFEELNEDDEIIVFVDADITCPPDWLAKLTAPINQKTHDPSTTYRWLIPQRATAPNLYASVINASVTTQGGNVRDNMPWGGSMAVSRETFLDLDVPKLFAGSLNDDLRLGKAAKRAGYKVGYVRNLVRPTEINFSWFSFLEFARRQYLQVKVFAPILYLGGNIIFTIYILGFVSIVAALVKGYLWAWVPLIIATLLDQVRAMTRESIYRSLFGHEKPTYRKIARTGFIEHCLTPVYMILHGLIIGSTWFMSKVTWGGVRYKVGGVNKTRVLKRKAIDSFNGAVGELSLPAGAAGFAGTNFETNTASDPDLSKGQAATISDETVEDEYIEETTPISPIDHRHEDTTEPTEPIDVSVIARGPGEIPVGACQFTIFDLFADVSAPHRDDSADDHDDPEISASDDAEPEMAAPISTEETDFEDLQSEEIDSDQSDRDDRGIEKEEDETDLVEDEPVPPTPPPAPPVPENISTTVAAVAAAPSAIRVLGRDADLPTRIRHRFPAPGKNYHYQKKPTWKPGRFPSPRAVSYLRFRRMTTQERLRMVRKLR